MAEEQQNSGNNKAENVTDQNRLDSIEMPLVVETSKLNADQYTASDIDGVTESLFGSGNLAYANLQASQAEAALEAAGANFFRSDSGLATEGAAGYLKSNSSPADTFGDSVQSEAGRSGAGNVNQKEIINTDKDIDGQGGAQGFDSDFSEGNFASSTVGSLGASQLSSDSGAFAPAGSGLSLSDSIGSADGTDGADGADGSDAGDTEVGEGVDGGDPSASVESTFINISLGDININVPEISAGDIALDAVTGVLDTTLVGVNSTISSLTLSLTQITNALGDLVNGITGNVLEINQLGNNVTELSGTLTQNISNALTEISEATQNFENILTGGANSPISLELNILDTSIINTDVYLQNIQNTDIDLEINFAPVYDLTTEIADLTGLDVLSEVMAELGGAVEILQGTVDQLTELVSDFSLAEPAGEAESLVQILADIDLTLSEVTGAVDEAVGGMLDHLGVGGSDETVGDVIDSAVSATGGLANALSGGATGDIVQAVEELGDGVTDVIDDIAEPLLDISGDGGLTNGLVDAVLGGATGEEDNADTDLTLTLGGSDLLQVSLDPVEDVIGDVDLDLGLNLDLSEGILFGGAGPEEPSEGSDITSDLNLEIIDNSVVSNGLEIPLDPVEGIIGDIGLSVDAGADILGSQAAGVVDEGAGGSGEDTLLGAIGEAVGEAVENLVNPGVVEEVQEDAAHAGEAAVETLEETVGQNDPEGLIETVLDVLEDGILHLGSTDTAGQITAEVVSDNSSDTENVPVSDGDINTDVQLDILGHDIGDLTAGMIIDPVEDLVGDIDLNITTAADLLNAENTDNASGDSDVSLDPDLDLTDIDLLDGNVEIELDPVESVTGDIDLDAGAATDLFGESADPVLDNGAGGSEHGGFLAGLGDSLGDGLSAAIESLVPGLNSSDTAQSESDLDIDMDIDVLHNDALDIDLASVLDPAEALVGDIDTTVEVSTDLLTGEGSGPEADDTDLAVDLNPGIFGHDLPGISLDLTLDPVEAMTGDMDVDVASAIDLFNDENPEYAAAAGDEHANWTESTIADGGGLFGDIVNGIDGVGDILPDPAGTVAEGIGALNVDPELDAGSLGGLFG